MAFDEVQLDPAYTDQASGGGQFSTIVMASASGSEQRIAQWTNPRYRWTVDYNPVTQATLDGLIDFFVARQGRARGFRFKDWTDFEILSTSDGITLALTSTTFQVQKQYISGSITRHRKIRKIVTGTITVFKADGTTPADANTIDLDTGIITFQGGAPIYVPTVTCEFDVPVRFDTDSMVITNPGGGEARGWQGVSVVEVLED